MKWEHFRSRSAFHHNLMHMVTQTEAITSTLLRRVIAKGVENLKLRLKILLWKKKQVNKQLNNSQRKNN